MGYWTDFAKDENELPFIRCPQCGLTSSGFKQESDKPCLDCLKDWLKEKGVPFMNYVMKEEES